MLITCAEFIVSRLGESYPKSLYSIFTTFFSIMPVCPDEVVEAGSTDRSTSSLSGHEMVADALLALETPRGHESSYHCTPSYEVKVYSSFEANNLCSNRCC